ncbi:uncharacterized protein PV07_01869 [Cladophialophora immunda]|uniref:Uncharacterized protein n=1 Tax=Cladophialophora immunda TaxID=569365 RepID=A0A0D2DHB9_9EURO|nr:uncharacterized protein PV07_01869 [Cladophialophora immunda]KIW35154.1 hypothetical protein PV07_01869 [Cladophialophora immunda]
MHRPMLTFSSQRRQAVNDLTNPNFAAHDPASSAAPARPDPDAREHLHAAQRADVLAAPRGAAGRVLRAAARGSAGAGAVRVRGHHGPGRRVAGAAVPLADGGGHGDRPDGGQDPDDDVRGDADGQRHAACVAGRGRAGPRRRPGHLGHLLPLDLPAPAQDLHPLLGLLAPLGRGPPHRDLQDQHPAAAVAGRQRHVAPRPARLVGRRGEPLGRHGRLVLPCGRHDGVERTELLGQ